MPTLVARENILVNLLDLRQDLDQVFDRFLNRPVSAGARSETLMTVLSDLRLSWRNSDTSSELARHCRGAHYEFHSVRFQWSQPACGTDHRSRLTLARSMISSPRPVEKSCQHEQSEALCFFIGDDPRHRELFPSYGASTDAGPS